MLPDKEIKEYAGLCKTHRGVDLSNAEASLVIKLCKGVFDMEKQSGGFEGNDKD